MELFVMLGIDLDGSCTLKGNTAPHGHPVTLPCGLGESSPRQPRDVWEYGSEATRGTFYCTLAATFFESAPAPRPPPPRQLRHGYGEAAGGVMAVHNKKKQYVEDSPGARDSLQFHNLS